MTFLRFFLVGSSATAVQYLVLVALVRWLGLAPVLASSCAYIISAMYNYVLSHAFTFQSGRAHVSAIPRFAVVLLIGLVLNASVVWLFADQLRVHYLVAQVAATLVTLSWNYLASLRWAFAR